LQDWKLRERLSNADSVHERVIRTFVERHDLATWQYEGNLRFITSLGPQGYPAIGNYIEGSVLPLILIDDTPAYSDKAIAFLRGSSFRPISAGTKLAAKFDLVRDQNLKEYMTRIWSYELDKLPQRNCAAGDLRDRDESVARASHGLRIQLSAPRGLGSIARSQSDDRR
jgi:hypothetical protein